MDAQTVGIQMISGAIAGAIADVLTHPLSTVKTRLQCQGAMPQNGGVRYTGPISGISYIIKAEGVGSLYKGIGVVLSAAAPGQAFYFAGYEAVKSIGGTHPLTNFLGGVAAQIGGSLAWVRTHLPYFIFTLFFVIVSYFRCPWMSSRRGFRLKDRLRLWRPMGVPSTR